MKRDARVEITCLLPERLLQRVLEEGVPLNRVIRPEARRLIVETDGRGARKLLQICARFSIPARIVHRSGASALSQFARQRLTLLAGLLICAGVCALFLGRIWLIDIEFSGGMAGAGDRQVIARALAGLGIAPGTPRAIDCGTLEAALSAQTEGYSYFGARVQGVRLLVEAVRETEAPDLYNVHAARDLVADRDGIVVSANARSGELCVAPGDTVRRGQLLIRGEEKAGTEETSPIAALGEVLVRSWFSGEARLPMADLLIRYTGREAVSSTLCALGLTWPIQEANAFISQAVTTQRLPIGGLFVPIEIVRHTSRETETEVVPSDRELVAGRVATLALADAATHLSLEGPAQYRLLRSWINFDKPDASGLHARAVYEIVTNAAVTRKALLQGG